MDQGIKKYTWKKHFEYFHSASTFSHTRWYVLFICNGFSELKNVYRDYL